MEEFSILDCEILWNKENKIQKSHMTAIKEELKTMSAQIKNAMKFSSDNEESIVIFCLNPKIKNQKSEVFYKLEIFVCSEQSGQAVWEISVTSGITVADIFSEKFRICASLLDENIQRDSFRK
jgi:hypothetical protein